MSGLALRVRIAPRKMIVEDDDGISWLVYPGHDDIVTARLTLDGAGRVVIPKRMRDALHLKPGDQLDLETAGESITLRPVREAPPITKEQGVWVFRVGKPLPAVTADETLRALRGERDQQHLGPSK